MYDAAARIEELDVTSSSRTSSFAVTPNFCREVTAAEPELGVRQARM